MKKENGWLILRDALIVLFVIGSLVAPNFGFVPFTNADNATLGLEIGQNLVPLFAYCAGVWLLYIKAKKNFQNK